MDYLIAEIVVCLVLAFALGALIGWLLKRGGSDGTAALETEIAALKTQLEDLQRETTSAAAESIPIAVSASVADAAVAAEALSDAGAAALQAASYEVEEIEGIGPGYGRRLREIGLDTTAALLDRCQTPEDMATIAEHCGIEHFVVQKWAFMADLLRIPGVRGQYSELLVYSGVDTVQDLATRKPAVLANELATLNAKEHRTEDVPNAQTLTEWIAAAGSLPAKL